MNNIEEKEKNLVCVCWKYLALFLLGFLTGLIFAPVKNGVEICSNNQNSMNTENSDKNEITANNENDQ